jgi:uncharacterized protein YcbK (DUF882 family)
MTLRRRELLIAAGLSAVAARRVLAAPSLRLRLKLKNAHTGETFDGYYRDADGPIPEAMADLRTLLRDFHVNVEGPSDVAVLDFLAAVMAASGQSQAVVLSAYRTPETNAKLRATTLGVAEKSQHLYGRAIDVTFDMRLGDAKRFARAMARGGVGWYPNSHFIHLDSGPVRNWDMGGSNLDTLVAGLPRGSLRSVSDRMAIHRALARREFLLRRGH